MLRIILIGLIIYLGYYLFRGVFKKEDRAEQVRGEQKTSPLDINESDVEDAHFEDIDEREQ